MYNITINAKLRDLVNINCIVIIFDWCMIEKVIKRLRDNFNEPFTIADIRITLSLVIGYQAFNPNIDDLEMIISMSDKKMVEDKRRQSNQ